MCVAGLEFSNLLRPKPMFSQITGLTCLMINNFDHGLGNHRLFFKDRIDSDSEVSEVRKKNIGIIFQSFYLIPNYTAVENVSLTLELNKFKNPEKEAKLLLERFGLKHRFNNLPSQLSGGEQQRVAIARAIAMKPELILADEPTGNLDTENSIMIANILFKYVKEEGSSLIMVTHDPKLADKAKRKIKINDGKIK